MTNKQFTLVLGGARSGKSQHAQEMAAGRVQSVLYVATAEPGDEDMATRISRHRSSRPSHWLTLEAQTRVGPAILAFPDHFDLLLLDCLTLLASNVIAPLPEPANEETATRALDQELDDLVAAYRAGQASWIVVSNEVGLGLVPPYPLGRAYRDALGRSNQRLASLADEVIFMIAGLPMKIK
jgi:adenosylcobinamide kinase/adenosylcobinamide-phosphate guanylyltransferase